MLRDGWQLQGEPGLAASGLAREEHQLRPAAGDRVAERARDQADLESASDARRAGPCPELPGRYDLLHGAPYLDERLTAAQRDKAARLVAHHTRRDRIGLWPDQHLAGHGLGLQPAGGVHDVAHRGVVAAGPQRADQNLTRVDPDAHLDRDAVLDPQLGQGPLHAQRRPHRSFGVVFVGERGTEQGDDGVADDLVDSAAEIGDIAHEPLETPIDELLHVLRVGALRAGREADEIGEQDGGDPAFVLTNDQRAPTAWAETGAVGCRRPAGRARHAARIEAPEGRARLDTGVAPFVRAIAARPRRVRPRPAG